MIGSLSVFVVSLVGIVTLLSLKAWENRRARILFPQTRDRLDAAARALKHVLERGEALCAQLPSLFTYLLMHVLAFVSVSFARWARAASEAAHRLADFISHKHNFERRELKSEFLKTMIEHKNGLAQPIMNVVKKRRPRKTVAKIEAAPVSETEVQSL